MKIGSLSLYSLLIALAGLIATFWTLAGIKRHPDGNEVMKDLAEQIGRAHV